MNVIDRQEEDSFNYYCKEKKGKKSGERQKPTVRVKKGREKIHLDRTMSFFWGGVYEAKVLSE